jgi:hypothetical protein
MPRVTPIRRTTLVEKRARALCAKLARVSDDTPMEYRMVRLMARVLALDYETADTAIRVQTHKIHHTIAATRQTEARKLRASLS